MSEREAAVAALARAMRSIGPDEPNAATGYLTRTEAEYILDALSPDDARALARALPGTLDAAWAAVEAVLPEDWEASLSVGGQGRRDLYTATASYCYSLRHYREHVGRARFTPFEMAHDDTPAAALLALAERLAQR